jgi:glycosyltransferase involved in cell wall biosynthesis
MPVFNGEKYLHQAITSALDQTLPPLEVIVVDDGSTDRSREIATSFGGKVLCLTQDHGGPSAARNLATQKSSGDWIAFLDADDFWLPRKLARQVDALEAHPEAGLVYTGRTELKPDGTMADVRAGTPEWVRNRLLYENPLFPSTVLARRSLLLAHPWDTALKSSEDWLLFYQLSRQTTFLAIEDPTAVYRLHPDSLTHRDYGAVLHFAQIVSRTIQTDLSGSEREVLRRKVDSRLLASAAIAAREQGSGAFLRLITKSLLTWPLPSVWPARYKLFLKMLTQSLQHRTT